MPYEYDIDLTALPTGALTNGQAIGSTGLTFASPSGGIQAGANGLFAGVAGVDSIAYIVLPEDLDVTLDWSIVVQLKSNGDSTNLTQVRFIGRKSVPGLSDDSAINQETSSGLEFSFNGGYAEGGRATHFYRNMLAISGKRYFGFGSGAGENQMAGMICEDHGPKGTNTGSGSYPTVDAYDEQVSSILNSTSPNQSPAFLRLRAIKFKLRSTTDFVERIWIRHGGLVRSAGPEWGPRYVKISPHVVGSSGTEVAAFLRIPAAPKAVLLHYHPNENSEWQQGHEDDSGRGAAYALLLKNNYLIATLRGTSDAGGTTYTNREACDWGSPSPGGTFRDALITYVKSLYPSLRWGGLGVSMGGSSALSRQLRLPTTSFFGIALLSGVTNIDDCYALPSFTSKISSAYSDQGSWSTIKATYDPALNIRSLQKIPYYALADTGDTLINTAANSQGFVTNINAKGGIATFSGKTTTGTRHLQPSIFDGAEMLSFFDAALGTANYTILPATDAVSLPANLSTTCTIAINRLNSHSAAVSFSASSLPSGLSASFNATPATGASTVLTLTGNGSVAVGTHSITINATDGTNARTYTLSVTVTAASADTTAPTLASATIGADGQTLTLQWTETGSAPLLPASGITGISAIVDGAPRTVGAGARSASTTTVHTLASVVYAGQVVSIGYDPASGNLTDSVSNEVATFSGSAVTNNSVQAPPSSATQYNRGPLVLRRPDIDEWEVLYAFTGDVFQVDCQLRFQDGTIPSMIGASVSALLTDTDGNPVGAAPGCVKIDDEDARVQVSLNAGHTAAWGQYRLTVKRTANAVTDDQAFGPLEIVVRAR